LFSFYGACFETVQIFNAIPQFPDISGPGIAGKTFSSFGRQYKGSADLMTKMVED